jgi:hypothetical protein
MWSSRWNENWQGKIEVLGENPPKRHFVHHKSHVTTWYRTRTAAVGSRRLTDYALFYQATCKIRADGVIHIREHEDCSRFVK